MKVFISWATDKGNVSAKVAEALHDWLPKVIQAVEPWMSKKDLTPGQRWNPQIETQLEGTTLGVFCVTKDGQLSQWMHFEAGALAKSVSEDSYVIPLLINMSDRELKGPLQGFQALDTSKEDIGKLVATLNEALPKKGGSPLSIAVLMDAFEKNWPDLEAVLNSLPKVVEPENEITTTKDNELPKQDTASLNETVDELLRLMRDTNSVINRLERSSTQPLTVSTPFGPGVVNESSTSITKSEKLHFSVRGASDSIRKYTRAVQSLADSQGFYLHVLDTRDATHVAISPLLGKIYLLLEGTDLPPRQLLIDLANDFTVSLSL